MIVKMRFLKKTDGEFQTLRKSMKSLQSLGDEAFRCIKLLKIFLQNLAVSPRNSNLARMRGWIGSILMC